jgi:hypothetical protein
MDSLYSPTIRPFGRLTNEMQGLRNEYVEGMEYGCTTLHC